MPRRGNAVYWRGLWWHYVDGAWGVYAWIQVLRPYTVTTPRGQYTEWRYCWVWGWKSYEQIREDRERTLARYREAVLSGARSPASSSTCSF